MREGDYAFFETTRNEIEEYLRGRSDAERCHWIAWMRYELAKLDKCTENGPDCRHLFGKSGDSASVGGHMSNNHTGGGTA